MSNNVVAADYSAYPKDENVVIKRNALLVIIRHDGIKGEVVGGGISTDIVGGNGGKIVILAPSNHTIEMQTPTINEPVVGPRADWEGALAVRRSTLEQALLKQRILQLETELAALTEASKKREAIKDEMMINNLKVALEFSDKRAAHVVAKYDNAIKALRGDEAALAALPVDDACSAAERDDCACNMCTIKKAALALKTHTEIVASLKASDERARIC